MAAHVTKRHDFDDIVDRPTREILDSLREGAIAAHSLEGGQLKWSSTGSVTSHSRHESQR